MNHYESRRMPTFPMHGIFGNKSCIRGGGTMCIGCLWCRSYFLCLSVSARGGKTKRDSVRISGWMPFTWCLTFFSFSLVVYNAASEVVVHWFSEMLGAVGLQNIPAIEISSWPGWATVVDAFSGSRFSPVEHPSPTPLGAMVVGISQSPPFG